MEIPSSIRPNEINGIVHVRKMFAELVNVLKNYSPASQDDIQVIVNDVHTLMSYITEQTSSSNKLADINFVNSSIATSTATFKGTVNDVASLPTQNVDNNDYAFVIGTDSDGNTLYSKYKYNGTTWVFEYALNNSSFTAAQWASIQSGVTAALVTKLNELYTKAALDTLLAGKVGSTSVRTIVTLNQAQYDALATKDANTEYNII